MAMNTQVKSAAPAESLTEKFKPEEGFTIPLNGRDLIINGQLVPFTLVLNPE